MRFSGKSMRTLNQLLAATARAEKVRLAVKVDGLDPSSWTDLGFPEKLEPNDGIIPSCVGPVTTFNAQGREVVRKDLPKVWKTFVTHATWHDWHGYPHSGIRYQEREVYQRERVDAPSERLYSFEGDGGMYIASRLLVPESEEEGDLLHLANLMMECFGGFDVLDGDTGLKVGANIRSLQWEILPKGQYPWTKAEPLLKKYTERMKDSDKEMIEYRMKCIADHSPTFLATGNGGFDGYFVYGFPEKDLYILESTHMDNATYAFKGNWEQLSQLTKSEIINGAMAHARIVHDRKWRRGLAAVLA